MKKNIIENDNVSVNTEEYKTINIDTLVKHDMHPRENIENIESLQNSIRLDGLQEALLVNETSDGKYEVLDGLRRLEALRSLKIDEAECFVKKGLEPEEAGRISWVKNVERQSFNPVEEAKYLQRLREKYEFSYNELNLRGYGAKGTISNKLKLLELPETVQDHIITGKLTETHGRAICELSSEVEKVGMARRFIDHDVSANRAEGFVKQHLKKIKQAKNEKVLEFPQTDIPGVFFKDASEMSELENNSVHLIVTSPPYGIGQEHEKQFKTVKELMKNNVPVLEECCRVLVRGGVLALNIGDIQNPKKTNGIREMILMGPNYQSVLRKHGVYLQHIIIWRKQIAWSKRNQLYTARTKHTSYSMMDNYEQIFLFRKEGERKFPSEDVVLNSYLPKEKWKEYVNGVWDIKTVPSQKEHPSEWPEELPGRLIEMFSCEGETVLDPFLGSGTTVKVARELNREAVGYEMNDQYKPVIMKKLGMNADSSKHSPEAEKKAANVEEFGNKVHKFAKVDPRQKPEFESADATGTGESHVSDEETGKVPGLFDESPVNGNSTQDQTAKPEAEFFTNSPEIIEFIKKRNAREKESDDASEGNEAA